MEVDLGLVEVPEGSTVQDVVSPLMESTLFSLGVAVESNESFVLRVQANVGTLVLQEIIRSLYEFLSAYSVVYRSESTSSVSRGVQAYSLVLSDFNGVQGSET